MPVVIPPEPLDSIFRLAVAAVDAGDEAGLTRLLAEHPRLVRERLDAPGEWLRTKVGDALDGFFKAPYLLWFVAEDPVRNAELPANVARLARTIIEAAHREGVDSLQQQLDPALHLAVCSPVGRTSGRQRELIDVLLDAGASIARRPRDLGGVPVQALICGNVGAAEQLIARGAELTLPAAVCLDRWDEFARLLAAADGSDRQVALSLAALNGKARGVAALVAAGADFNAYATGFYTHATPLHHAVCSGSLDTVEVLVEAGASFATKDTAWNGTALGWAAYYQREHAGDDRAKTYEAIAAYLRAKGAPDD